LTLHHVGVVVREIAPAVTSYRNRFGYEVASEAVHDPKQTAVVQFLRLPGDSAYLELVAPDEGRGRLTRALEKGGGLHHLCYATDDIERSCTELRAQGLFLIHPPEPAEAFGGRRIAWLMGKDQVLVELVERGPGPL
jgi:methylmalonyl-CoA/ethylmalonyl-CoA epimerase